MMDGFGWTYDQYMEAPVWVVEGMKMIRDVQGKRQRRENNKLK